MQTQKTADQTDIAAFPFETEPADPSDSLIYSSSSSNTSAFNSPGASPLVASPETPDWESPIGGNTGPKSPLLEPAQQPADEASLRVADLPAETIQEAADSIRQNVLTEGTNSFTITLEQTSIDEIDVYLFKFINIDEFSTDLSSSFNLLITDNNSNTIIQAPMGYSNNQYSVSSTGTGVIAGVITSNGVYCGKLMENHTIVQFILSISDSEGNVLCKYTIDPIFVDSSNLLSFGAIDEIYVRKTDNDNDISDIKNDIDGKADKEHTLTKSEINDLTISDTIYDINNSILVSLTESIEDFNVEVSNTAIQFTTTSNFDASIFSSFTVSSNNFTNTYTRRNINTRSSASPKYTSITSKTYFQIADLPTVADTYTITDSSGNVLCKYTVNYSSEVDSSTVITFGAIDETYTRKTELDSFKTELIDLF